MQSSLEVELADIYQPGSALDMPKRPAWNYRMSRKEVETQESNMFTEYLEKIYSTYECRDLSYFELNLEVNISQSYITCVLIQERGSVPHPSAVGRIAVL